MALLKNICQNLNKKLSDIELANEFRQHGLFFEYLKSECITEENEAHTTSVASWNSSQPVSTISSKYQDLQIQDSIFFRKWWSVVRNRRNSSRKTDVIQLLDAVRSNDFLLVKFKNIFGEYDTFMKMYRKLEALIQKQLFLIVCLHTVIVWVAIHIFMEIHLEWGDLLDEKNVKLAKVNFTIHLLQIFHDFGCLALTAITCRNEVKIKFYFYSRTKQLKKKIKIFLLDKKYKDYNYKVNGYAIL